MAAKNKRPKRAKPADTDGPRDVQQIFALHLEGSARRDVLLEEARDLLGAGKVHEAKKMLAQAESIQRILHALENECRLTPRHRLDRGG